MSCPSNDSSTSKCPSIGSTLPTSLRTALEVLSGLRLCSIGRAADLLWLHFGDRRTVSTFDGRTKEVGSWALHVQTPWRFTRGHEIIVGLRDIYYRSDNGECIDEDIHGISRFDRHAAALNAEFDASPWTVRSIVCDRVGGFSLEFDLERSFDVFPNVAFTSEGFEFWRLFEPGTDNDHYVVETTSTVDP